MEYDWMDVAVEPLDELDKWKLLEDLLYPVGDGTIVRVKKNFITDLTSIPRILWNAYPPYHPRYRASAIMHDGIYAAELFPRSKCDWLFLEALQKQGNNWCRRNMFYSAVRCFGGSVWGKHTDESRAEARKFVSLEMATS